MASTIIAAPASIEMDPAAGFAARRSLWQAQAQATVHARLADGCTPEEALRCAAGPLKAARHSRRLHALAEIEAAPARPALP